MKGANLVNDVASRTRLGAHVERVLIEAVDSCHVSIDNHSIAYDEI